MPRIAPPWTGSRSGNREPRRVDLERSSGSHMLERDRVRRGFSVGQVAYRLGVSIRRYRELVEGDAWPDWETWDRICKLYGWPQTFSDGSHGR
jgi:hypothetical protein